jgi:hypothetical protein
MVTESQRNLNSHPPPRPALFGLISPILLLLVVVVVLGCFSGIRPYQPKKRPRTKDDDEEEENGLGCSSA